MKRWHLFLSAFNKYLPTILLALATALLLSELVLSLAWRMDHDTPLLHYAAFLIDNHGFIPYKDIFETSFPGTFLFHLAIGKLFGYGERAFRFVDVGYLLLTLGITWGIMRQFGQRVAWASVTIFGLTYLGYGPKMSLQRDYLGILPIAAAVLLVSYGSMMKRAALKAFLIGVLFGLPASIKPHLAIGLPFVVLFLALEINMEIQKSRKVLLANVIKFGLLAACGFLLSVAGSFVWLWQQGGLPYFWEIFTRYLPLYLELSGAPALLSGLDRWIYLAQSYQLLGHMSYLLIPASLGLYLVFFEARLSPRRTRLAGLLGCLALVYSIYPVFSGQFWSYHWMPFDYFAILCSALVLIPLAVSPEHSFKRVLPILVFVYFLVLAVRPAPDFLRQVRGLPPTPPENGRVDAIADFLRSNLEPGDKVQPLATAGGVVHAMLISQAVIATPFMEDYPFYHHLSNPYIQLLWNRYMSRMQEEKPRFIIELHAKPKLTGEDTTRELAAMQSFIQDYYDVAQQGQGYTIFELKR